MSKGRRLSDAEVSEIIRRYTSGESASSIAARLGVSATTIFSRLKQNGVPVHNQALLNRATPEQEQQAVELYREGSPMQVVGDRLGINESLVRRILQRNNVPRRSSHDYRETFTFDEHFFDEVNTEEKVYMLGFLYADGCLLQDRHYSVRLNLHEKDLQTLERFKKLLKSTYRLYRFKRFNQWCLQVPSEHMWRRLKELGCPPKKTLKLKYPTWLPDELENHFVRGYFDGDGTIGIYDVSENRGRKEAPKVGASIMGTRSVCEGIASAIERATGHAPSVYKTGKGGGRIWKLGVGGPRLTLAMMDFLYADATIFVKRKHATYLRVKEYCDRIDRDAAERRSCSKCGKKSLARGLCRKHYVQWKRTRTDRPTCSVKGCDKVSYCRTMCEHHYGKWRTEGADRPRCAECDKPAVADGRCQLHYKQKRRRERGF